MEALYLPNMLKSLTKSYSISLSGVWVSIVVLNIASSSNQLQSSFPAVFWTHFHILPHFLFESLCKVCVDIPSLGCNITENDDPFCVNLFFSSISSICFWCCLFHPIIAAWGQQIPSWFSLGSFTVDKVDVVRDLVSVVIESSKFVVNVSISSCPLSVMFNSALSMTCFTISLV